MAALGRYYGHKVKQFLAKLIANHTVFDYGSKPSRIDKFVHNYWCSKMGHNDEMTDGIHYCKDCGVALHAETIYSLGEWRTHLYNGEY